MFPKELFSHEAHLRLAWIHISKYGEEQAADNICLQLLQYVKHIGTEEKYNEDLTIAAVKVIHHFIKVSESNSFKDFIEQNPVLKTNFKDAIMYRAENK